MGDALKWLTGTATTKDTNSIKQKVNKLIEEQQKQQDTLVHVISVLNITRYNAQLAGQTTNNIIDTLTNITRDLRRYTAQTEKLGNYVELNQILIKFRTVLAQLRDSLSYLHHVAAHTMDYVEAATTHVLTPRTLPIPHLHSILENITATLPANLALPTDLTDILHFYRFLTVHVFAEEGKFLLLIDIPIQDRRQQLTIFKITNLPIPKGNFSLQYNLDTHYMAVNEDETMLTPMSTEEYETCRKAKGQFCVLSQARQLLATPSTCLAALYKKDQHHIKALCFLQTSPRPASYAPIYLAPNIWIIIAPRDIPNTISIICPGKPSRAASLKQSVSILHLNTACSATSSYFQLPRRYESPEYQINLTLQIAGLHLPNYTASTFRIWNHIPMNWTNHHLQHLTKIPAVPVADLYRHLIPRSPLYPFADQMSEDTSPFNNFLLSWKATSLVPATLILAIGMYCFISRRRNAYSRHRALSGDPAELAITDDNVSDGPVYRCVPRKPDLPASENHSLCETSIPPKPVSRCKPGAKNKGVPVLPGSLNIRIPRTP